MKKLLPIRLSLSTAAVTLAAVNAALASPIFQPIAISPTNFNADAIVEKTATAFWRGVNGTVDNGTNVTGNTWFEIGYNGNQVTVANAYTNGTFLPGVPHPGTTFVGLQTNFDLVGGAAGFAAAVAPAGTYQYQMAPSYTNFADCILIDTVVTTNFITITTPKAFGALTFLDSSGNGGNSIALTIYHQDGTTDTGVIAAGDWFGGSNPAYIAYGRCNNTQAGTFDGQGSLTSPGNPRWYGRDIRLVNTTSPVTGIGFGYVGGASSVNNQVFAISGAATTNGPFLPVAFTGYNRGVIVPAGDTVPGPALCTVGAHAGTIAASVAMNQEATDTGNTWFEQGYLNVNQPQAGVPVQGSTWTNFAGDHAYTMAPDYTTNDVIYVAPNSNNIPMTFSSPKAYSALSLLIGTSYGPQFLNVQVNFSDATSETHVLTLIDWFTGTSAVWFSGGGVSVDTMVLNNIPSPPAGVPNNEANPAPFNNPLPYLHNADFILTSTNKLVTGLLFTDTNAGPNGASAIFAVSGATGAVPPVINALPSEVMPNAGQTNAWPGDTVQFNVPGSAIVGNPPYTLQWQTDGGTVPPVFTNFVDNGTTIVGSQTTNLTLSNVQPITTEQIRIVAYTSTGTNATQPILFSVAMPLGAGSPTGVFDVCTPGDPISLLPAPDAGSTPSAEGVVHAIDGLIGGDPGKYLNFSRNNNSTPFLGPIGFVTTPSVGPSVVTGMQLYTANDTATGSSTLQVPGQARDPEDVGLYGSNDGGNTWHFIYGSSALEPPTGRNSLGSGPYNETNSYMQQVLFKNTNTYFTYGWFVTNVFSDQTIGIMQIGEVVLIGTNNPAFAAGFPTIIVTNDARAYVTNNQGIGPNSVSITATIGGTPAPTLQWAEQVNGTYVNLTNGVNISGVTTSNLSINNMGLANAGNYRLTASNSFGVVSANVAVTVYAPAQPSITPGVLSIITSANDTIADFGDLGIGSPNAANTGADQSPNLLFSFISTYINPGSGPSAGAGFVPFGGPTGFIIGLTDPTSGNPAPFIVTGIRLYAPAAVFTGTGSTGSVTDGEPNDMEIFGSNDNGKTFNPIYSITGGALYMQPFLNALNSAMDPVNAVPVDSLAEVLFPNPTGYSTYKIQFTHCRNDQGVNGLYLGHVDLLGIEGAGTAPANNPTLTFSYGSGKLTLTSTAAGEVYVTSKINPGNTVWNDAGPITANGNVQFNIATSSNAFYQVIVNPTPPIH